MPTPHPGQVAFLLAQVGGLAADRFAERVAALGLKPPQAGLLRLIAQRPGSSQRDLAATLGLFPSRVVTFVDELEERGLVVRRRSTTDRRQHALELTEDGEAMMRRLRGVAEAHGADLVGHLDDDDRTTLARLLGGIAEAHGLTEGVHPGFKKA